MSLKLQLKFKSECAPLVHIGEVRYSKEKFGHKTLKQAVETARNSQRNMSKVSGAPRHQDCTRPYAANLCMRFEGKHQYFKMVARNC